jgi:hypothetical protein
MPNLDEIISGYYSKPENKVVPPVNPQGYKAEYDPVTTLQGVSGSKQKGKIEGAEYFREGQVFMDKGFEKARGENQTFGQELWNAVTDLPQRIGLGIVETAGYMLDLENYASFVTGSKNDYSNWLSNWAKESADWMSEDNKVYLKDASAAFNPSDSAWWVSNGSGLIESISEFWALGALTGGGAGLLGNTGKLGRNISKARQTNFANAALKDTAKVNQWNAKAQGLEKTTNFWNKVAQSGSAIDMGIGLGAMNGSETYNKVKEMMKDQWNPKTGMKFSEAEIEETAAKSAATTFNASFLSNALLNYTSITPFFRGNKVPPTAALKREAGETTASYVDRLKAIKADPNKLATGEKIARGWKAELGLEMGQEALEEYSEAIAGQMGENIAKNRLAGKDDAKTISEQLSQVDWTSDEALVAMALGAVGGGFGTGIKSLLDRNNDAKQDNLYEKAIDDRINFIGNFEDLQKKLAEARSTGDDVTAGKTETELFVESAMNAIGNGTVDLFIQQMEEVANMTEEEAEMRGFKFDKSVGQAKSTDYRNRAKSAMNFAKKAQDYVEMIRSNTSLPSQLRKPLLSAQLKSEFSGDVAKGLKEDLALLDSQVMMGLNDSNITEDQLPYYSSLEKLQTELDALAELEYDWKNSKIKKFNQPELEKIQNRMNALKAEIDRVNPLDTKGQSVKQTPVTNPVNQMQRKELHKQIAIQEAVRDTNNEQITKMLNPEYQKDIIKYYDIKEKKVGEVEKMSQELADVIGQFFTLGASSTKNASDENGTPGLARKQELIEKLRNFIDSKDVKSYDIDVNDDAETEIIQKAFEKFTSKDDLKKYFPTQPDGTSLMLGTVDENGNKVDDDTVTFRDHVTDDNGDMIKDAQGNVQTIERKTTLEELFNQLQGLQRNVSDTMLADAIKGAELQTLLAEGKTYREALNQVMNNTNPNSEGRSLLGNLTLAMEALYSAERNMIIEANKKTVDDYLQEINQQEIEKAGEIADSIISELQAKHGFNENSPLTTTTNISDLQNDIDGMRDRLIEQHREIGVLAYELIIDKLNEGVVKIDPRYNGDEVTIHDLFPKAEIPEGTSFENWRTEIAPYYESSDVAYRVVVQGEEGILMEIDDVDVYFEANDIGQKGKISGNQVVRKVGFFTKAEIEDSIMEGREPVPSRIISPQEYVQPLNQVSVQIVLEDNYQIDMKSVGNNLIMSIGGFDFYFPTDNPMQSIKFKTDSNGKETDEIESVSLTDFYGKVITFSDPVLIEDIAENVMLYGALLQNFAYENSIITLTNDEGREVEYWVEDLDVFNLENSKVTSNKGRFLLTTKLVTKYGTPTTKGKVVDELHRRFKEQVLNPILSNEINESKTTELFEVEGTEDGQQKAENDRFNKVVEKVQQFSSEKHPEGIARIDERKVEEIINNEFRGLRKTLIKVHGGNEDVDNRVLTKKKRPVSKYFVDSKGARVAVSDSEYATLLSKLESLEARDPETLDDFDKSVLANVKKQLSDIVTEEDFDVVTGETPLTTEEIAKNKEEGNKELNEWKKKINDMILHKDPNISKSGKELKKYVERSLSAKEEIEISPVRKGETYQQMMRRIHGTDANRGVNDNTKQVAALSYQKDGDKARPVYMKLLNNALEIEEATDRLELEPIGERTLGDLENGFILTKKDDKTYIYKIVKGIPKPVMIFKEGGNGVVLRGKNSNYAIINNDYKSGVKMGKAKDLVFDETFVIPRDVVMALSQQVANEMKKVKSEKIHKSESGEDVDSRIYVRKDLAKPTMSEGTLLTAPNLVEHKTDAKGIKSPLVHTDNMGNHSLKINDDNITQEGLDLMNNPNVSPESHYMKFIMLPEGNKWWRENKNKFIGAEEKHFPIYVALVDKKTGKETIVSLLEGGKSYNEERRRKIYNALKAKKEVIAEIKVDSGRNKVFTMSKPGYHNVLNTYDGSGKPMLYSLTDPKNPINNTWYITSDGTFKKGNAKSKIPLFTLTGIKSTVPTPSGQNKLKIEYTELGQFSNEKITLPNGQQRRVRDLVKTAVGEFNFDNTNLTSGQVMTMMITPDGKVAMLPLVTANLSDNMISDFFTEPLKNLNGTVVENSEIEDFLANLEQVIPYQQKPTLGDNSNLFSIEQIPNTTDWVLRFSHPQHGIVAVNLGNYTGGKLKGNKGLIESIKQGDTAIKGWAQKTILKNGKYVNFQSTKEVDISLEDITKALNNKKINVNNKLLNRNNPQAFKLVNPTTGQVQVFNDYHAFLIGMPDINGKDNALISGKNPSKEVGSVLSHNFYNMNGSVFSGAGLNVGKLSIDGVEEVTNQPTDTKKPSVPRNMGTPSKDPANSENTQASGVEIDGDKIEEIINNSTFIKLSDDGRYYINTKTGKKYERVTNYINGREEIGKEIEDGKKENENELLQSASTIGTNIDNIVRDFFMGGLKSFDEYGVTDNKSEFDSFIKELNNIKKSLDARGEKVYSNNIMAYNDELGVAGEIDLLTVDKNGVYRIYDMKTMRGNHFVEKNKGDTINKYESTMYGESKKSIYQKQLSMYRILLYKTHGVLAESLGILPIEVDYKAGETKTSKMKILKGVNVEPLNKIRDAEIQVQPKKQKGVTLNADEILANNKVMKLDWAVEQINAIIKSFGFNQDGSILDRKEVKDAIVNQFGLENFIKIKEAYAKKYPVKETSKSASPQQTQEVNKADYDYYSNFIGDSDNAAQKVKMLLVKILNKEAVAQKLFTQIKTSQDDNKVISFVTPYDLGKYADKLNTLKKALADKGFTLDYNTPSQVQTQPQAPKQQKVLVQKKPAQVATSGVIQKENLTYYSDFIGDSDTVSNKVKMLLVKIFNKEAVAQKLFTQVKVTQSGKDISFDLPYSLDGYVNELTTLKEALRSKGFNLDYNNTNQESELLEVPSQTEEATKLIKSTPKEVNDELTNATGGLDGLLGEPLGKNKLGSSLRKTTSSQSTKQDVLDLLNEVVKADANNDTREMWIILDDVLKFLKDDNFVKNNPSLVEKIKKLDKDINHKHIPFKLSAEPVQETINLDEAGKWLRRRGIKFDEETQILNYARKVGNQVVHGYFSDGLVYLSRNAESGTEYHEAFHMVLRTWNTKEQQQQILQEAEQKYGDSKMIDGKIQQLKDSKQFENLSEQELRELALEEILADKFAEYVKTKQRPRNLLQKAWEFFKDITKWLKTYISNKRSIDQVFSNIESGFINKQYKRPVSSVSNKVFAFKENFNARYTQAVVSALSSYFVQKYDYNEENGISKNPVEVFQEMKHHFWNNAVHRFIPLLDPDNTLYSEFEKICEQNGTTPERLKQHAGHVLLEFKKDMQSAKRAGETINANWARYKFAEYNLAYTNTPENDFFQRLVQNNKVYIPGFSYSGLSKSSRDVIQTANSFLDVVMGWNNTEKDSKGNLIPEKGFMELTRTQLKSYGVKVIGKLIDLDEDFDQEQIYDRSAIQEDRLDNLSGRVKNFFARIPELENGQPKRILDIDVYLPFQQVYSNLQFAVAKDGGVNNAEELLQRIQQLSTGKPEYNEVYQKMISLLQSPKFEDRMLFNEIYKVLNMTYYNFVAFQEKIKTKGGKKVATIRNFESNSQRVSSVLFQEWNANSKRKGAIYSVNENGETVVNSRTLGSVTKLVNELNNISNELNKRQLTNKDLRTLGNFYYKIGIDITPQQLSDAFDKGIYQGRKKIMGKNLFNYLVKDMSNEYRGTGRGVSEILDRLKNKEDNDIYEFEKSYFKKIAKVAEISTPVQNRSFINAKGVNIFPVNLKTTIGNQLNWIKFYGDDNNNDSFVDELSEDVLYQYEHDGVIRYQTPLLAMIEHPDFKNIFDFSYFDAYKRNKEQYTNNEFKELTDTTQRLYRYNAFANNSDSKAMWVTVPTMADRSNNIMVKLPRISTTRNLHHSLYKNHMDILLDYVLQDLKRMQRDYQMVKTKLAKGDLSDLVKNYHYKKGKDGKPTFGNFMKFTQLDFLEGSSIGNELRKSLVKKIGDEQYILNLEQNNNLWNRLKQEIGNFINTQTENVLQEMDELKINVTEKIEKGDYSFEVLENPLDLTLWNNDRSSFARDFVVGDLIAKNELRKFTAGDVAFSKGAEDYCKRYGGISTPGLEGVESFSVEGLEVEGDTETYAMSIIEDAYSKEDSYNAMQTLKGLDGVPYKNLLDSLVNRTYKKGRSNKSDAMGYVTVKRYRSKMKGQGTWSTKHEEAYQNYQSGGEFIANDNTYPVMMPLKTYHDGLYKVNGKMVRLMIKHSTIPLLRDFTKHYPDFDGLRKRMEAVDEYKGMSEIDEVNSTEGVKVGAINVFNQEKNRGVGNAKKKNRKEFDPTPVKNKIEIAGKNTKVQKMANYSDKLISFTEDGSGKKYAELFNDRANTNDYSRNDTVMIHASKKDLTDDTEAKELTLLEVEDAMKQGVKTFITAPNTEISDMLEKKGYRHEKTKGVDFYTKLPPVKEASEKGTEINFSNMQTYPVALKSKNQRIPQVVPEDVAKNRIGSQLMKIITASLSLYPDSEYTLQSGAKIKGKDMLTLYNDVVSTMIDKKYKELEKRLSMNSKDGTKYLKRLRSIMLDTIEDRNLSQNYEKIFNITDDGNFEIPMGHPSYSRKLEQAMVSLWKNNPLTLTINGKGLVQIAEWGTHQRDGSLKYIRNENNEIQEAEIAIPWDMAEKMRLPKDANGEYDLTKVPKEFLTIIGYRIPTQGKNSMLPLRIKRVLNKSMGKVILIPGEITAQMGSDFDIDKLYTLMPNIKSRANQEFEKIFETQVLKRFGDREDLALDFNDSDVIALMSDENYAHVLEEEGKLIDISSTEIKRVREYAMKRISNINPNEYQKVNYNYRDLPNQSQAALENLYVDLVHSILVSKNHIHEILSPIDSETMPSLRDLAKKSIPDGKVDDLLSSAPTTEMELARRNLVGKSGIGIYATQITGASVAEFTDVEMVENYSIKIKDPVSSNFKKGYSKLNRTVDDNGTSTVYNINKHLNIGVDNAKDPIMAYINDNPFTSAVTGLFLRSGVTSKGLGAKIAKVIGTNVTDGDLQGGPVEVAAVFRMQPIIRRLTKYFTNNNYSPASLKQAMINMLKEQDESLEERFEALLEQDGTSEMDIVKMVDNIKKTEVQVFQDNKLLNNQLQALANFYHFYEAGREVNNVNKAYFNTDVLKNKISNLGKVNQVQILRNELENTKYVTGFLEKGKVNYDLSNSYWDVYEKMFKQLSKHFVYGHEAFTAIKQGMSEMTGKTFNDKVHNDINKFTYTWLLAQDGSPVKHLFNKFDRHNLLSKESDMNIANQLNDIKSKKKELGLENNAFLSSVEEHPDNYTTKYPVVALKFNNSGKMDKYAVDNMVDHFDELFEHPDSDVRALANKLVDYCIVAKGLTSGADSFSDLIPVERMTEVNDYLRNADNIMQFFDNTFATDFIETQFEMSDAVKTVGQNYKANDSTPLYVKKYNRDAFKHDLYIKDGDKYKRVENETVPYKMLAFGENQISNEQFDGITKSTTKNC